MDLGRRSRRSVTSARKVREEGDGADRRARGLSESDARAGGERCWQVGLRVGALMRSWALRWTGLRRAHCAERKGAPTSGVCRSGKGCGTLVRGPLGMLLRCVRAHGSGPKGRGEGGSVFAG